MIKNKCNHIKDFIEDDTKVAAINRILYIIAIDMSVIIDTMIEMLKAESFSYIEIKKIKPKYKLVR